MSETALHLDSTRARAAWLGPSGVMLPVLDTMGQAAMPMAVAEGPRGELLTGRQAFLAASETPSRAHGPFLHQLGAVGATRVGRHEASPGRLLELSLEPMKRARNGNSYVSLAAPAYLDDTALTAAARAVESAGWKVRVAAPSALALWSAAREQAGAPSGIVCECDDHALSLSLLGEQAGRIRIRAVRVLRHLALPSWRKAVIAGLADATIRSCRRDPRADSRMEGVVARHAASWLDEESPPARTATLELKAVDWNAKLKITPGQVVDWCATLLRSLGAAVTELQMADGAAGPPKALVLASTMRLPGVTRLAEALHENWLGPLHPDLPLGAQLGWLAAIGRGDAGPGLWREAPVFDRAEELAGQGAP